MEPCVVELNNRLYVANPMSQTYAALLSQDETLKKAELDQADKMRSLFWLTVMCDAEADARKNSNVVSGLVSHITVSSVKSDNNTEMMSTGDDHSGSDGESKGTISCPICAVVFTQKGTRNRHVRVVHNKYRPFSCKQCPATFAERSNLNKHTKTVHDNQKPFGCNECGKMFPHRAVLMQHIRSVHEKIRPFVCQTCNSRFSRKSHLKKHEGAVCGNEKRESAPMFHSL